jgi:hypothetical protein
MQFFELEGEVGADFVRLRLGLQFWLTVKIGGEFDDEAPTIVVGRPKNGQRAPRIGERVGRDDHPFSIRPRSDDLIASTHKAVPCQGVGPGFGRSNSPRKALWFDACPLHRPCWRCTLRVGTVCGAVLGVGFGGRCRLGGCIVGKPTIVERDLELTIVVPALAYLSGRVMLAVAVCARNRHGRRL